MNIIQSKLASLIRYTKDKIVLYDLYPTTITFTYDGNESFKTLFGGITSIAIRMTVLIIALTLLLTVIQRGNTFYSYNKVFRDLTNDSTQHYFAKKSEAYFAIKLTGPNPEKLLDPNNNSLGYSVRTTEIEYEICGDRYPYSQKEIYDRIGLSTFICPKGADFFVRSNVNSDNFQAIQISISRCSISNCKSSSEIQTILKTHYVNLAILSSYFDVNDYESPIHHYLQDKNIFYFTTYVSQRIEYKIKQNQLFLSDSIWFGSQGYSSEINFYSIDKGETIISDTTLDNSYMQFFIFLDQQIDQNQRTVYSFLDMLGYLGGIFGVLFKLGMIIVGTISNKSFYASMLPTLFHEDSNQKCDSIHKTFKKNKSMDLFQRKSSINEEQKCSSSFQIEEFKCAKQNTTFEREETKSDIKKNNSNIPCQHHYNNEIDHQALTMQIKQIDIKTRTPFKYSIKELIFDIICLHRCKFKGKTCLNRNKRHNAFTQAIKEFNSELDCVSIIKSIREMKAMIDIMMSENQQKLLKCYQSKQVKQEKISLATITPDNQNNFQFSRNTRSIRVSEQDKCDESQITQWQ